MFRFENELYLWFLLVLPILALIFVSFVYWRKKAVARFGDTGLVQQLIPEFSSGKLWTKFILYLVAMGLVIIGLANPQVGTKLERVERKGVDVIIAVDVSRSMLAEDLTPNRIEVAKRIVAKLIDQLGNDRVGIIVFAGNAYLQVPLTVDYSAAKLLLRTLNTDMVPAQGTALGEAIELASEHFDPEATKFKAMILITDGENHESGAIDAAEKAAEEGVIIHTMGIGSEEGGTIPVFNSRGQRTGVKKDNKNQIVNSKLEESALKEISKVTDGRYFRVKGSQGEVNQILGELQNMEKKDFEDRVFTDYEDQFQYFLFPALLLLLIDFFLSERRNRKMEGGSLFKKKPKTDTDKKTKTNTDKKTKIASS